MQSFGHQACIHVYILAGTVTMHGPTLRQVGVDWGAGREWSCWPLACCRQERVGGSLVNSARQPSQHTYYMFEHPQLRLRRIDERGPGGGGK